MQTLTLRVSCDVCGKVIHETTARMEPSHTYPPFRPFWRFVGTLDFCEAHHTAVADAVARTVEALRADAIRSA